LKEKDKIDERVKQLENKIDKFKIWKEKFSNMKLISETLNLSNTKYAIQLKETGYIIWKFRRKWKSIGEVFTRQNIIMTDNKFAKRKKEKKEVEYTCESF
jgi:hypothetical protein